MAVIEDESSFIIEERSGEVLVVSEQSPELVAAIVASTVQVEIGSVSIIEEEPAQNFIIEAEGESIAVIYEPEQVTVQTAGAQGPPGPPGPPGLPETDIMLAQRIDFQNNDTVIYKGEADPGSLESELVWRIKRTTIMEPSSDVIVEVIVEWANGNASFDNAWDDHLTLPYS